MNCPECGKECLAEDRFCTGCGFNLGGEGSAPAGGQPESELDLPGQIAVLRETLSSLATQVSQIADRVSSLGGVLCGPVQAPQPVETPQPAQAATANLAPSGNVASRTSPTIFQQPLGRVVPQWLNDLNCEWLLGGNWLAKIGVVALVFGIGFFLKLAFDNNWIGETGRVALGLGLGLAFLGAGEYWQKRYPIWSQPITGGGIAILYLSIFAAFSFYQLIPPLPALGLSFLVTVTGAGLALRNESMAIAVLGIMGGFLTPVLLSEHLPDERILLAYVLVLDLGVLALATFRNWRWFTLLGLLGSLALFGFWLDGLDPGLLLAQAGITAIFVIFIGATTLFHIIWKRVPLPMDLSLMVINATAYFGISYGLLFEEFRLWMGGFTLLLTAIYGTLGYAVLKRSPEQVYLSLFSLAVALIFLTIAIPVQLAGPWVSIAWAVEGTVLIWLSFTLKMNPMRWMGMLVLLIFSAWLLLIDTPAAFRADLRSLLNPYTLAYVLAIAATSLSAYLLHREREALQAWENNVFTAFLALGSLFLGVAVPVQVSGMWIPIAWATEGVALIWLSFRLNVYQLRLFALGLFAVMLVRLIAFETFSADLRAFSPIINERFAAFAAGIIAFYVAAYISWLGKEKLLTKQEWVIIPAFLFVANLLTLWVLSVEVISTVDAALPDVARSIVNNLMSLSLSMLWALYAALLIVLGFARRLRWVRLAGLALLMVPVVKLFVFDVFELEQGYRVVAFMGLGAILVAGGFLYQKFRGAIREFLLD